MLWLIDGMNVIGTRPDGWWKDRDAAMLRLVDMLERWAVVDGQEVTVVFERQPRPPIRMNGRTRWEPVALTSTCPRAP